MKSLSSLVLFLLTALSSLADPVKLKILALIAEREYETQTTLPAFFENELKKDYDIAIIRLDDGKHDFAGLEEKLKEADLLFVSVRRRTPTESQLTALRKFMASGRPVLGIRTASHAFAKNKNQTIPAGHDSWQSWDADVFGGSYSGKSGEGFTTNKDFFKLSGLFLIGRNLRLLLRNILVLRDFLITISRFLIRFTFFIAILICVVGVSWFVIIDRVY